MESEGGQKSQGVAGRDRATVEVLLSEGMSSPTTSSQGQFQVPQKPPRARASCRVGCSGTPFQTLCGFFGLPAGHIYSFVYLFIYPPALGLC